MVLRTPAGAADASPAEPYAGGLRERSTLTVKYTSAHIDGVESEVVVNSPHSCQSHPDTINEVQRILRLHLRQEGSCTASNSTR